jgi:hypothetical protein
MTTLTDIETQFEVAHLDHLDKTAELPVISGLAFQGDVAIIPATMLKKCQTASTPIPRQGVAVVRGENGGNTHALFGTGFFDPAPASPTNLSLGTLTVPTDAEALLSHPEHGGFIIAPGTYELRRQREQADELRLVAD